MNGIKNRKQLIEEQSEELAKKISLSEDITQDNIIKDKEIKEDSKTKASKSKMTNKRIDFDRKTIKRLDMMLPAYSADAGEDIRESELYSYVVRVAVNALFEGDFKKKIDEL